MRGGQGQGHFVLLHPSWCVGERNHACVENIEDENFVREKSKQRTKDQDRRCNMPMGMWDLINTIDGNCVREVTLRFFGDEVYGTKTYQKPSPCCTRCDPKNEIFIEAGLELKKSDEKDSIKRPWFLSKLRQWKEKKAQTTLSDPYLRLFPSIIMPDIVLDSVATWAEYIHDEESMRRRIGNGWSGIKAHLDEILNILKEGQKMRSDIGEMYNEWKQLNDIKRQRTVAPFDIELVEIHKRRETWLRSLGFEEQHGGKKRRKVTKAEDKRKRNQSKKLLDQEINNSTMPNIQNVAQSVESRPRKTQPKISAQPKTPVQQKTPGQIRPQFHSVLTPSVSVSTRELAPSRSRRERRLPSRYAD